MSSALHQPIEQLDASSFDNLVKTHASWVYGCALRQTGNAEDARDLAQAAFLLLHRKAHTLPSEMRVSSWLFNVVRLEALSLRRQNRRRAQRELEAARLRQSAANVNDILPVLDDAVAALGEQDRRSILLRFYQRLTFARVGQAMQISENAARKRVDRALVKLKTRLAERGVDTPVPTLDALLIGTQWLTPAPAGIGSATSGAVVKLAAHMQSALHWNLAKVIGFTMLAIIIPTAGIVWAIAVAQVAAPVLPTPVASTPVLATQPAVVEAAAPAETPRPSTQPVTLRGRVVDLAGKPVANAEVWVLQPSIGADPRHADKIQAASNGTFSIVAHPDPELGRFALFRYLIIHAQGLGWTGARLVGTHSLDIELPAASPSHLKYVDVAGAPIVGLKVRASSISPAISELDTSFNPPAELADLFTRTTDQDGVATWEDISEGWSLSTFTDDDRFAAITLGTGQSPDVIALQPAVSLAGRVTAGEQHIPVAGLNVQAWAQIRYPGGGTIDNAGGVTDADGRYILKKLLPGDYHIDATPFDPYISQKWACDAEYLCTVRPGEHARAQDINLISGGIVTGTITDSQTHKPIARAFVTVNTVNSPQRVAANTDKDGKYFVHSAPGKRTIGATTEYGSEASKQATVIDGQTTTVDLAIPPASDHPARDRVVFDDGTPAEGARIFYVKGEGAYPTFTAADRDGMFSLPSDDLYTVWARLGTLGSDQDLSNFGSPLTLTLHPAHRQALTGTVTDNDGKPLEGIHLRAWGLPGLSTPAGSAITDAHGHYTFKRMWMDSGFRLYIAGEGYAGIWRSVLVKNGKFVDTDFKLAIADGVITGRVVDATGQPMPDVTVTASGHSTVLHKVKTQADGTFTLIHIATGERTSVQVLQGDRPIGTATAHAPQKGLEIKCAAVGP